MGQLPGMRQELPAHFKVMSSNPLGAALNPNTSNRDGEPQAWPRQLALAWGPNADTTPISDRD